MGKKRVAVGPVKVLLDLALENTKILKESCVC